MTAARILAIFLAFLSTPSWAANLGVTPVAIQMGGSINRTTVSVVNNGPEAVTMQAETIAWKRIDGVDQDGETSDVMVNPAVFTIEPGQTQIVRVGLRRPNEQSMEATYRLVLREVPVASDPTQGTSVRVLVAMRLPIYVAPDKIVQDEKWQVVSDARNNLQVTLYNRGNVHYKVGSIKVRADDAKESTNVPLASSSEGAVLFPGESRTFTLKQMQSRPLKKMPVTLEVFTDRGPQTILTELQKGD
ncbi:fimbria/pilus periplasmic chaperone [uncultured Oxalicibacterium sp.]|uniref:fimbrial biogenesis chaperone n=1 Tax=uncultured Oxalicibacterium sp. TaxID=1168540 RepID=UPI0025DF1A0E|nr:fimbria/pilus periplasmic chaperone [uncultured Oxalicibacterium sp.]